MHVRVLAVAVLVGLAGCYHATIETGLEPSNQVVENKWAHSFIAGLVPPSTVETASECPNGVAIVETELSFLNLVANAVTWGIYSPMHIKVTCAAGGMADADGDDPVVGTEEAGTMAEALSAAAIRSWQLLGTPVYARSAGD